MNKNKKCLVIFLENTQVLQFNLTFTIFDFSALYSSTCIHNFTVKCIFYNLMLNRILQLILLTYMYQRAKAIKANTEAFYLMEGYKKI